MGAYVNGTLVPPVDAATLDGVTAAFQPTAGKDGYAVTFDEQNDDLILTSLATATTDVYNFTSSTGFTLNNGAAGTALITGGVAQLSNPAGTQFRVQGAYNGPSIYRALPNPSLVDVAVRLAVGPVVVASQMTLEISETPTSGAHVCALVTQAGDVLFYRNDTNATLATAAGVFPVFNGQQWVRVRAIPGFVAAYYGTGVAGAIPTAWTQVGSQLALSAFWAYVSMGLIVVDTVAVSTTAFDDLNVLNQPPTVL